jgi:hypothetical protein
MTFYFYLFMGIVGLLLVLFIWSQRKPRQGAGVQSGIGLPEECGRHHATYLPQIQQALAKEDDDYVSQRGSRQLQQRFRKERRRVALAYLIALREDFRSLLQLARIIAVLSPEVAAMQELERLRLMLKFGWRFELLRVRLWAGFSPVPELSGLANVVSGLSVRMEKAIKELGERAALASKLGSSLDGSGIHPV